MDKLKKVLTLYQISIRSQLSYKANFILELIIWSIYTLLPLFAANLLLQHFAEATQNLSALTNVLYGSILIGYNLARMCARGFDDYQHLLLSGHLDIYFTRPMPIILQILGHSLFLRRIAGILSGITALIYAYLLNSDAGIWLACLVSLLLTELYIGLMLISSAFLAITKKTSYAHSLLVDSSAELGFYPTDLLQTPAREVFMFIVPIYTCAYLPLKKLVFHEPGLVLSMLFAALTATAVLFLGALLFNASLKHYQSANE